VNRKLKISAIYISLPLIAFLITYLLLQDYFFRPLDESFKATALFEVAPDKTFREVAADLEEKSFIRHSLAIRILAKFQKKDRLVMAGEYELSPSMTPQQILDAMVEGKMVLKKVTVKEGSTLKEIGLLLESAGVVLSSDFNVALQDAKLREDLKVPAESLEGYLFPETYRFPRNTPARKVIQMMRGQLDKAWNERWNLRLLELQLTKHQILTLASIIEKESGKIEELPYVSSVFHNRLNRSMRLQSDPTVIYGIPNFNGNLTKTDLQTPTAYNTYIIPGLPPGPIASPGANAIKAALYPATSEYLFFVGNGEGEHVFSETLEQHNEAVNRFQRGQRDTAPEAPAPPSDSNMPETSPTPLPE